jgi:hypothetical protein
MRRFSLVLFAVLIVVAGVSAPRIVSVSASGHSDSAAAKTKCKKGFHRVHGKCKKKKQPVVAPTPTPTLIPTLETGIKVDVGGYKLFIGCIGMGSPTVVLDSNLGVGTSNWEAVVPDVSSFTRVCAYDRAGVGNSDPRLTHPGTSEVVVKELRTLLANAHVDGPYVLVGHTIGGENMRLYAYLHPDEVTGLIQIDATPVDGCTRYRAICAPPGAEEDIDIAASDAQLDTATHGNTNGSLGNLPLVILSDGMGFFGSGADPLWDKLQAELATASSNSVHVIATASDHLIPSQQPKLVVEAIQEVVTAARSTSHTLPPCGQAFERLRGKCTSP